MPAWPEEKKGRMALVALRKMACVLISALEV